MKEADFERDSIGKDTIKYLYQARWIIVLIGLITFVTHGSILFSQRFGIDTDAVILGMYSFKNTGRQGLCWLAGLLGLELDWFNLYFAQGLTILFMILSPVALGWLYYLSGAKEETGGAGPALLAMGLSFVVSPFWVAQIYFLNQSAQVLLAFVLTAVGVGLAEEARKNLRRRWYLIPVVIAIIQATFSSYQILILVYIMAAAVSFLICSLKEKLTLKESFQWIAFHGLLFIAGFLVYLAISSLFFLKEGNYLLSQISWTKDGFVQGLRNCYSAIRQTLTDNPPFYTGFYGVFCLVFLALFLYRLLRDKERSVGSRIIMMMSALFLCASPYVFILLYGGAIVDRMQLAMPLSQGSMLYLTVLLLSEKERYGTKALRVGARLISLILILILYRDTVSNLSFCSRLYYTDEFVFEYASRVAGDVYRDVKTVLASDEIEEFRDTSRDNVVLLGYPEIPYNAACVQGSTIGLSIYEFEAIVNNSLTRERSRYFMQNVGYPLSSRFEEGEVQAFRYYFEEYFGEVIDQMPSYPVSGYVKCVSDEETGMEYIVVKLGQNWRTYSWD